MLFRHEKMKQYKAIFIDWDDTIGDFRNAAYRSMQLLYADLGLDACFSDFDTFFRIYSEHNTELWTKYGLDQVTKEYLEFDRMFYPLMMAEHPFAMDKAAEMAQKMAAGHLEHTTSLFSLLPDAEEVVRYLSNKYSLVVLSNGFVSVQYRKIDQSGLRSCFSDIILSEEVGCQKPNPRIYEIAMARGGWKADEVLMIGDSWTSDIQGAINSGIDQLWITGGSSQDVSLPATYKVERLRDVLQML